MNMSDKLEGSGELWQKGVKHKPVTGKIHYMHAYPEKKVSCNNKWTRGTPDKDMITCRTCLKMIGKTL